MAHLLYRSTPVEYRHEHEQSLPSHVRVHRKRRAHNFRRHRFSLCVSHRFKRSVPGHGPSEPSWGMCSVVRAHRLEMLNDLDAGNCILPHYFASAVSDEPVFGPIGSHNSVVSQFDSLGKSLKCTPAKPTCGAFGHQLNTECNICRKHDAYRQH